MNNHKHEKDAEEITNLNNIRIDTSSDRDLKTTTANNNLATNIAFFSGAIYTRADNVPILNYLNNISVAVLGLKDIPVVNITCSLLIIIATIYLYNDQKNDLEIFMADTFRICVNYVKIFVYVNSLIEYLEYIYEYHIDINHEKAGGNISNFFNFLRKDEKTNPKISEQHNIHSNIQEEYEKNQKLKKERLKKKRENVNTYSSNIKNDIKFIINSLKQLLNDYDIIDRIISIAKFTVAYIPNHVDHLDKNKQQTLIARGVHKLWKRSKIGDLFKWMIRFFSSSLIIRKISLNITGLNGDMLMFITKFNIIFQKLIIIGKENEEVGNFVKFALDNNEIQNIFGIVNDDTVLPNINSAMKDIEKIINEISIYNKTHDLDNVMKTTAEYVGQNFDGMQKVIKQLTVQIGKDNNSGIGQDDNSGGSKRKKTYKKRKNNKNNKSHHKK